MLLNDVVYKNSRLEIFFMRMLWWLEIKEATGTAYSVLTQKLGYLLATTLQAMSRYANEHMPCLLPTERPITSK